MNKKERERERGSLVCTLMNPSWKKTNLEVTIGKQNTRWKKEYIWDNLQRWCHWFHFIFIYFMFIVGNLCGTCKIPLRIVYFPSETPLEKIKYSFVSGYQLQAACRLGMGQVSNSPFSSMTSFDSEPCRLCACCLSCF